MVNNMLTLGLLKEHKVLLNPTPNVIIIYNNYLMYIHTYLCTHIRPYLHVYNLTKASPIFRACWNSFWCYCWFSCITDCFCCYNYTGNI